MDTAMIRELYDAFLNRLSERSATINYDPGFDILYVPSERRWSPEMGEKPRTFAVASGIHIDVLRSSHQVFGVEIADFDDELHAHGDRELIAWWTEIRRKGIKTVKGKRLAEAMRRASLV